MNTALIIRSRDDIPLAWVDDWYPANRTRTGRDESFDRSKRLDLYFEMRALALATGKIEDQSYSTVRYGWVASYSGECTIEYRGKTFVATGLRVQGTPEFISQRGTIVFKEK